MSQRWSRQHTFTTLLSPSPSTSLASTQIKQGRIKVVLQTAPGAMAGRRVGDGACCDGGGDGVGGGGRGGGGRGPGGVIHLYFQIIMF